MHIRRVGHLKAVAQDAEAGDVGAGVRLEALRQMRSMSIERAHAVHGGLNVRRISRPVV